jgi:hypothetical protein
MHVFIDESGDCGMTSPASPGKFTLAAVFVESGSVVEAFDAATAELRRSKGFGEGFLFHFTDNSEDQRRDFLKLAAEHQFYFFVSIMNKRRLVGRHWADRRYFYEEAARRLVDPVEDFARIARACNAPRGKVLISHHDDPVYISAMKERFKRCKDEEGSSLFKPARPQRPSSSTLLQLADAVCGAFVHLQDHGSDEYTRLIRRREGQVVEWP